MAGLEVLYQLVKPGISCGQDAVLVCVHWEMIKHGCKCLGSGDQSSGDDRKSELLPADWNDNKEVYTLRYQGNDGTSCHVLKAITVDSSLLFNLMNTSTQQVSELTVNISDHINEDQLHSFDRVYKDLGALCEQVRRHLVSQEDRGGRRKDKKTKREQEDTEDRDDPLRIPTRHPRAGTHPHWSDPMVDPFAAGGADLDPFGVRGGGGMIVDPLRAGPFPHRPAPSGIIPDILPPGAVPPGARFDPFGPVGRHRPGPDPDHLPPPGYDDMYM